MNELIPDKNLYSKIVELLAAARQNVVRTVNQTMVYTYYEIGRMIVEDEQHGKERAEYGKQVLKELSKRLSNEFGKGFSKRNLEQMRLFYLTYSIAQTTSAQLEKVKNNDSSIQQTASAELENDKNIDLKIYEKPSRKFILSWSHYLKLMRIENLNERSFYEIECASNNWSLKELERQFNSALYERLVLSRNKEGVKQLAEKGQVIEKPLDFLKDPYILEFLNLSEHKEYSENDLESEIIDKLEHFLLELGKGFTFAGRQVRLTFDESHFKADLVFYNRLLKCFVIIDLKIGKLTHQDIGQMQMYVNYYDRIIKLPEENKTIGIILCKDKSKTLVEFTLLQDNDSIFASKYQTILPDKQDFINLLNQ